jgi:hypothetical protein
MHMPNRDPDGRWPSCDDEPPGISIRPLRHADLAALLAHLNQHNDGDDQDLDDDPAWPTTPAPVVAFRVSADTLAWRRGATGERRTARLLARLERRGWAVLHDLAIPGSAANIDHLLIGPGGVVVIDSKQYRGRLRLDQDGLLWHGCHLLSSMLRTVRWEADQADEVLGIADLTVAAIVAVHGASVPWGRLAVDGVTVTAARRVPDLLQALPAILGPERVAWLADRARLRFRPAA